MSPEELEALMPLPMQALPRDPHGRVVPWFVEQTPDRPLDLRIASGDKRQLAHDGGLCWICGQPLGKWKAFLGGPLSLANRCFADWAGHRACATFALMACPALNGTMARRPGKEVPADAVAAPGHLDHLPPVVAMALTTRDAVPGQDGLFHLLGWAEVQWWQKGARLSPAEALPIVTAYLAPHGFNAADVALVMERSK